MNKYLLTLTLLLGVFFQVTAATVTWDGGGDGISWLDPLNWDTDAIPTMADDVDLDGQSVTLSGSTQVLRVFVDGSATFTVDAGATLTVNNNALAADGNGALEVQGSATLVNNGTISVANTAGTNNGHGYYNKGTTTNNGTITIDGINVHGLYVVAGTFTNAATGSITVTNVGMTDTAGDNVYVDDANSGTLFGNLVNDGTITVMSTSGDHAIYVNDNSTFDNNAVINLSKVGPAGDDAIATEDGGIFNNNANGVITINSSQDHGMTGKNGVFNNNAGGTINIDAVDNEQIFLDNTTTFTNSGIINLTDAGDVALYVTDQSTFTNAATGVITITASADHAVYIDGNSSGGGATLVNSGIITVDGAGGGTSSDGVRMGEIASMTNNAGASLIINNAGADGIQMDGNTTFDNSGAINIDGTKAGEEALELVSGSTFNNLVGGTYTVANCGDDGIEINNGATLNNDGDIRIDGSADQDIETFTGFTFVNSATATFGPGSSPGDLITKGDWALGASTTTFEIDGLAPGTDYDQIVNGDNAHTLTITGATADLVWGFVPAVGDCFKIIDGSGTVAGTFASVTSSNSAISYEVDYANNSDEVRICVLAILPVELTSFEGKIENATSLLSWQTQTEQDNDYFEVQHSTDGREFSTIGMVQGNGTTQDVQNYDYTHKNVTSVDNYYRLRQVDFDGDFEHSEIIYLKNDTRDTPVVIYPNPARDLITYDGAAATLTFFDIQGKQIMQQVANERTTIDISVLNSGVYTIEILTNTGAKTFEKLIKK